MSKTKGQIKRRVKLRHSRRFSKFGWSEKGRLISTIKRLMASNFA